jgi:hypothetical protein
MRKLIYAALLLPAVAAMAQQAAPPKAAPEPPASSAVTPEARQVARELFESSGGASLMGRMLDAMHGQVVRLIMQQGVNEHEAASIVDDLLTPEFKAHIGELQGVLTDIYASHYSVGEMRQMEAWNKTSLGQKMLSVAPQIAAESFAVGSAWGERIARDAIAKHQEELRRRGVNL